ncbi:MAG TPA: hypothetical protein VFE25_04315 [Opitutaceae bacterium]|jgi:hypothetical protein|nr:hypothetical protein [Opitutaceae bacterium]
MLTDPNEQPAPRPVSMLAIIAVFVLLSAFGLIAERLYFPTVGVAPQNDIPEHLSKDLAWKATPESRKKAMLELRQKQADQGAAYGWVDQKSGVVQLPIARAMELVVQENGGSK